MMSQLYDIFRKDSLGQPVWVQAVETYDEAKHRIIELGARRPGQYMIFSQKTGQIMSTMTTVASPATRAEHRSGSGRSEDTPVPRTEHSETVF